MSPLRQTDATLEVLEFLVHAGTDEELYGWKITQAIGRPTGTVYPILARLEQTGWLESRWESDEPDSRGPRRRFYRLTPTGLAEARDALAHRRAAPHARPRPAHGLLASLGRL